VLGVFGFWLGIPSKAVMAGTSISSSLDTIYSMELERLIFLVMG
jgi:hypothetical protein